MANPNDFIVQPVNALGAYLGGVQARQGMVEGENRNALLKMQQQSEQQRAALYQQQQAQGASEAEQKKQRAMIEDLAQATDWVQQAQSPEEQAQRWNQVIDAYKPVMGDAVEQYRNPQSIGPVSAWAKQQQKEFAPESYGAPVAVAGGDLVQFGSRGGAKPTGFKVPPKEGHTTEANLDAGGLDLAAETYLTTGKLPPGMNRNPKALTSVINRASELATMRGDDSKAALLKQQAFKATQGALSSIKRQQAMVGAFEKTALKNLLLARDLGRNVDRTGSPIVNKALLAFRQGVSGDPETAAFVNALVAARTEYAKVLSGATGAQGITDSARHEAEDLFSKATNQEALERIMEVAQQEMKNRMVSFDEQIAELQGGDHAAEPASNPQLDALLDKYK